MEKVLVIGHRNPDTDSICSALAYAHLKKELGVNAEAVRLGEVNKETAYALDYFNLETPRFIEKVDEDVKEVILVDHNEFQQSVSNISDVRIAEVIDHHRVANFETKDPLYFRVEPVGCTATILNKMYKEHQVEIPKHIAGLMVSAIISDSLLFKSPTCTDEDIKAAKELAKIAEVDLDVYGLEMLKAGTDLKDKSMDELLANDAKTFDMNGHKVEINQINAVDLEEVYEKQAEFEKAIKTHVDKNNLSLYLLVVTDILNSNSDVLAIGTESKKVEQAFHVTLTNNRALLKGVVSRKKQIVPNLTDAFNG
ncbi:manganese-dependent inorganic pyrophosphatase [Cerasibacillus quisquiliarum]|uniref:Probable manganese-dependent inorganic pyrophosphatase n=1 Tax=Cerasibacillus quisquiliarum TaxID=227865 RepID=A0A511V1I4_9BACI|nr:manganese-dependent inorganic pyrophosphatase [Cerasibacillus quisquiliarum]MBB5147047.1 manganese-dependent inorganic pyrophosphatase [Cerasibacillus quisquiliarum]GEN31881.1 manganese-dependent inorganic pyrophosphatase [Cerasibacillus quisquiliarum]